MQDEVKSIFQLFSPHEMELEARLKKVSNMEAETLLRTAKWKKAEFEERRYKFRGGVIRERKHNNGEVEVIKKTQIKKVKLYNEWITWVLSREENTKPSVMDLRFASVSKKERWSLICDKVLQVDVTYNTCDRTWSVEVEVIDAKSEERIVEHVRNLVTLLKGGIRRITSEIVYKAFSEPAGEFSFEKRIYQKPITLTNGDLHILDRSKYRMTPKIDGERRFACILNGNIYTIDLNGSVKFFSPSTEDRCGLISILDCELANERLFALDAVVIKGRYIGNMQLKERLSTISKFPMITKPFAEVPKNWSLIPLRYKEWSKIYKSDGIIFIPETSSYTGGKVFKWKESNTVDLEVARGKLITSDGIEMGPSELRDGIYEFSEKLEMIRPRNDKPRANSMAIVKRNLSLMQSFDKCPVTKWTRSGKGMIDMRRFHNLVKRAMYKSENRGPLLDIGTGQGGDIKKWDALSFVYCIEPEEDMIRELEKRLSQHSRGPYKIIKSRARYSDEICRQIHNRISLISLFFVMNSFDEEDIDGLMEIMDQKCMHSCRVIGSFLDAKLLREASNEDFKICKMENKKYRIEIRGTRIKQIENEFTLDSWDFSKKMETRGFALRALRRLESENLSIEEKELSSMFVAFDYRR